jgi:hypothetical protein
VRDRLHRNVAGGGVAWFPGSLAWKCSNEAYHDPANAAFKEWIQAENGVGGLTFQEEVSLIPPLVLGIQPHHASAVTGFSQRLCSFSEEDRKHLLPQALQVSLPALCFAACNCLPPSTVCPQLFALNCLPSTVCPQLSALNCLPSTVCLPLTQSSPETSSLTTGGPFIRPTPTRARTAHGVPLAACITPRGVRWTKLEGRFIERAWRSRGCREQTTRPFKLPQSLF